ncbi:uncharacterized protein LOC126846326 [Adelges cooleyi]|uniref:uncharacterized protein LOC126846326 n=1 Tax=Adelges cooleyi TaxID=133065 RepID=UPI00217FC3FE|nr:uncharacterized protein LOC126846326 [Adelges cooleyi]
MRRYPLPYWAFVPALGVWPDGSTTTTTTSAAAPLPPPSPGIRVDVDRGQVSVIPLQKFQKYNKHPNTPSVDGPSKLKKTQSTERPVTKIYLKPAARAKAGPGGVALANPISTAVVRRGDTVSIEYLPDATAEAGAGGVAISRPEFIIQLVD